MNNDETNNNAFIIPDISTDASVSTTTQANTGTSTDQSEIKQQEEERDSVRYAVSDLARSTFWLKLITIPIIFICGFGAILALTTLTFRGGSEGALKGLCMLTLACSCCLPVIGSISLWKSANRIRRASLTGEQSTALSGIKYLNNFFKFMGINAIIILIAGSGYFLSSYLR